MSTNESQRRLISLLADNLVSEARREALRALEADGAESRRAWRERRLGELRKLVEGPPEVPGNCQGFLVAEDAGASPAARRYYLSGREEELLSRIERRRAAAAELSRLELGGPNAALLHGPSGTGKTGFGKFLARREGLPFVYVKISGLVDSYMGGTPKNIEQAFEFARREACVLMLDELDCMSANRAGMAPGREGREEARMSAAFMQGLDALPPSQILLAATNRLDLIDAALLRRFSIVHEVRVFDPTEKAAMLRLLLADMGQPVDEAALAAYCEAHEGPQALCARDAAEALARSICDKAPFRLAAPGKDRP